MIYFLLFASILITIRVARNKIIAGSSDECIANKMIELISAKCLSVDRTSGDLSYYKKIQKRCGKENVTLCTEVRGEIAAPCYTESEKTAIGYAIMSEQAMFKYMCSDGINDVKAMKNFDGRCISRRDCREFSLHPTEKAENYYNEENCKKRVGMLNCTLRKYDNCDDKSAYTFFKNLGDADLNATPCTAATFVCNILTFFMPFMALELQNYFF